jgi:Leucine-rich repeat (LRR) protein
MTKEYFKKYCERDMRLVGKGPENSLILRELSEDFQWWDVVAEYRNLERLTIYGAGLTSLGPQLKVLKNIKYLGVRFCPLDTLPDFLLEMPKLKTIYFQGTNITELPSRFFEHSSLEEMHLEANKISDLPELNKPNYVLKKLMLSNNLIEFVPNSFQEMLPNLEAFNLVRNPVSFR